MNHVNLVGRLVRDPDVYRNGDSVSARFTTAVNRRFKNKDGNYDADFISCVSFGKTAEFIEKYFRKGMAIGINGEIRTGSYTNKEGVKVYTTDVYVNDAEFVESKNASQQNTVSQAAPPPIPPQVQAPAGYNVPPVQNPQQPPQQMQHQAPPVQQNYQQNYQQPVQQQAPPPPQQTPQQAAYQQAYAPGGFMNVPPTMEEELPFT
jgi:single-strand DNA-binding protein